MQYNISIPLTTSFLHSVMWNVFKSGLYFALLKDTEGEHEMAHLVETLRYKPEGRGFDSRWCHWNFSLT